VAGSTHQKLNYNNNNANQNQLTAVDDDNINQYPIKRVIVELVLTRPVQRKQEPYFYVVLQVGISTRVVRIIFSRDAKEMALGNFVASPRDN
jgi:hypothetical protein